MDEWIEIGENSDKTTQSAELEDGTTTTLTENFYDGERLALQNCLSEALQERVGMTAKSPGSRITAGFRGFILYRDLTRWDMERSIKDTDILLGDDIHENRRKAHERRQKRSQAADRER